MRWLASVLALILLSGDSSAQTDCVEGMVVLRLFPAQNPALTASPPTLGIQAVDQVLAQYSPTLIRPFLVSPSAVAQSEAVDQMTRTYIVYYSDSESPHVVVADLLASAVVETAFVNKVLTKYYFGTNRVIPTDSEFHNQWNLENANDQVDIDAPEAWAIEMGQPSEVIGIIDLGTMVELVGGFEGVYSLHFDNSYFFNDYEDVEPKGVLGVEDLDNGDALPPETDTWKDNVIGYRFPPVPVTITNPTERLFWKSVPHDWLSNKHGVHVASIAAAKAVGGYGIAGVANGCKVYTLRDGVGVDDTVSGQQEEADAIRLAADFSRVINMSWGFFVDHDPPQAPILQAIAYAIAKDCVLVAASGNTDVGPPEDWICPFPANLPQVLTVGSISSSLVKDSISRYDTLGVVDVMAPVGDGIPANSHTDCPPDELGCPQDPSVIQNFAGTSAACPQAAGVAALVRSRFPGLTQDQVRARIKASAEWYWGSTDEDLSMYGAGKINAYRALSEWGSITESTMWTTNTQRPNLVNGSWVSRPGSRDGKYYVSGDLTIEEGKTLTIAAGTVVRIAPDHERSGADLDRVQIIVRGTLNVVGDVGNPVVFESFKDGTTSNSDWVGIKFETGSSGSIVNATFKNASRAIENYTPLTGTSAVANCTFTQCGTAIEAHASVTATGTLIANNDVAVDIYSGTTTLTKCTLANNATSATVTRTGTSLSVSKCVTALNGGPAVRALSGGTGTATMDHSVVYQNGVAAGSRTDAQWQTDGTAVYNTNPAFCDAASGAYSLYAYSPASAPAPPYTGYFGERVGALDAACVPGAQVTAVAKHPISVANPWIVMACPKGDADTLVIFVDLSDAVTRPIDKNEITLDVGDVAAKVFDADGYVQAGANANAPDYATTITHSFFGGCAVNDADILLNGMPLASRAHFEIRTIDTMPPYGVVDIIDFGDFGTHYQSPPKPYSSCYDADNNGQLKLADFAFYGAHYQHLKPTGHQMLNSEPIQSDASVALQFTEDFPTATSHKLYVDVTAENFDGITSAVFSMRGGSERLEYVSWLPTAEPAGDFLFAPVTRDGEEELFFGLLIPENATASTHVLGRLVFEVADMTPIEITDDNFELTVGDVMIGPAADSPVVASMGGTFSRTFDPAVARVYHDRLEQNFPNPFNPTTTLAFSIKSAANVNLAIYDVAGRRVRELVNERMERGAYRLAWDGRNDNGTIVSSGVYFYKLVAGSFIDTKKMTILK
jgi:hypothetical protein